MKFKWNLQPEFQRYKENQHTYTKESESGEYLGCVRVGNLCFDIVDWGNHLWFDLYVGGVDTGYGYGADKYPYDYCDAAGFAWNNDLTNVSDDDFKKELEEYIEEHVNAMEGYVTDFKAIPVSLIDKANEELNMLSFEYGWGIVADNDGIYPDKMGCAACLEFGIKKE